MEPKSSQLAEGRVHLARAEYTMALAHRKEENHEYTNSRGQGSEAPWL